nr:hypothetical protein [Thermoproteota archaeon]
NDQTIAIEEDLSSVEIELLATHNNQDDILNLEFAIVSQPAHGELGEIRQGEEAASSTAKRIVILVVVAQLPKLQ